MKDRFDKRILDILEWPLIEEKIISLCVSDSAKRLASKLKPVPESKVKVQMKKISAMKDLIQRGNAPQLSGISDIGKGEFSALMSFFRLSSSPLPPKE
ncbi:MAG: hypothetical protein CVV49_21985 [Spirochaetae bacterium HGW-Spirochaetae-5]|nr:MAG: hypothetical protein CVV49_21985 [Spirochaetae bacterium HGW-Spirochaetae-5]